MSTKQKKYEFKVDFPVGTDDKGKPKKEYKKGKEYPLDPSTASYLKAKNVIK